MSEFGSETKQVLTFTLGSEEYCIPIEYVAEIVEGSTIREIPNTDPHVKGVTDLRGETTTVIDPSDVLEVDAGELVADGGEVTSRIVVLDVDVLGTDSPTGWLVSEVKQVVTVSEDDVDKDVTGKNEYLHGFLQPDEADDGFTIWVNPREFTA